MNVTSHEIPVVKRRSPPGALLYSQTRLDARHSETDVKLFLLCITKVPEANENVFMIFTCSCEALFSFSSV